MTTTYDITNIVGQMRLKIGDITLTDPIFTDEELTYFYVANTNNINLASATALESWAARYGANADSENVTSYSYTQSIVTKLLAMAKRLRDIEDAALALANNTPAADWAEMDLQNCGEDV
jgi:alanine dehydrogenase